MAVPAVPAIEADRIADEKAPHYRGNRYICGSQLRINLTYFFKLTAVLCGGRNHDDRCLLDFFGAPHDTI